MPVDHNAVALFVTVVELGSFSKAALREGVPVSTVSRKVAALERGLGTRLLHRSTRQLRLTEAGAPYFAACRQGIAALDAAHAQLTQSPTALAGRLRISVPPSMSELVVLPPVRGFQALHPRAVLHCLVTERFVDPVADGIDVSLRVGSPRDSSLVATTVSRHRPLLVAAPGYLQVHGAPAHPNALAAHVQVAFARWEQPLRWLLHADGAEPVAVQPEPALVINDYAGVLDGLLHGMGVGELPAFIADAALQSGRLVPVLPAWAFAPVAVSLTYASNRQLSPLLEAFRAHCREHFARHPLAPA